MFKCVNDFMLELISPRPMCYYARFFLLRKGFLWFKMNRSGLFELDWVEMHVNLVYTAKNFSLG